MKSETEPMAYGFLVGAFFFLGCLLVVQTSCAATPRAKNAPTVGLPSVAKMVLVLDGEDAGHCTAWKAANDRVFTAGHCCEDGYTYRFSDGMGVPGSDLKVLVDDDEHDVCVLEGKMRGAAIPIAMSDPFAGDYVWTAGYPVRYLVISGGFWSERVKVEIDDHEMILGVSSTVVRGGSSGSPMLNADGRAVGILVAGYTNGGDNIAFSTTIEWLRYNLQKSYR